MTKLNIDHLYCISKCRIIEDEPLEFINGLAIAKVDVVYLDNSEYTTYTVIKEERDSQTEELIEYKIAGDKKYINLSANVKSIIRSGKRFFFETGTCGGEPFYYVFEHNQEDNTIELTDQMVGQPTLTKNPDVVILSTSEGAKLYHLDEHILSDRCSEIEVIDRDYFLVTNSIEAKGQFGSLRNNLIFTMDKYGNKTSRVYSRNKPGFTDDGLGVPYEEIEKREIQVLRDKLDKEENQKRLFRSNPVMIEQ